MSGSWEPSPCRELVRKRDATIQRLAAALKELVRINEEHNEAVSVVIGKPLGWKDAYLDEARAALREAGIEDD